ncbi:MAG: hypothetical protein ACP5QT_05080 [Brevinematia bacterium]
MDEEERILLIRRGNELFNKKDYKNALKIFLATDYKDGIIRVADYLYFDKGEKLSAIKLYKKAGHQKVIDDFAEKVASIIRMMLKEDEALKAQEKEATVSIDKIETLDNPENKNGKEKNDVDERK